MKNNLPQKYEGNFIFRIKRFFSNLFVKKSVEKEKVELEIKEEKKEIHIKENSIEKMKKESKKVHLEDDILRIVEENPKLINTLTLSQLEKLNDIYDKVIIENDRKIQSLRRKLA